MIPLSDESFGHHKVPIITLGLIATNILVFLLTYYSSDFSGWVYAYGAIPQSILNEGTYGSAITSLFLHSGWLHLIGNLWFLWIFGDNVEHSFGSLKFLLFYLVVGIAATFTHIASTSGPESFIPVIGASGAISGVMGAYTYLFPKNRIRALQIVYTRPVQFFVPAYFYLILWFILQAFSLNDGSGVSYTAHIGGFICGMVIALILGKKEERVDIIASGSKSGTIRPSGWEQD